jgi:hypothetical protein
LNSALVEGTEAETQAWLVFLAPHYAYRRSCSYLQASVISGQDLPSQGIITQAWFSMMRESVRFEWGFAWRVSKRPLIAPNMILKR